MKKAVIAVFEDGNVFIAKSNDESVSSVFVKTLGTASFLMVTHTVSAKADDILEASQIEPAYVNINKIDVLKVANIQNV